MGNNDRKLQMNKLSVGMYEVRMTNQTCVTHMSPLLFNQGRGFNHNHKYKLIVFSHLCPEGFKSSKQKSWTKLVHKVVAVITAGRGSHRGLLCSEVCDSRKYHF